MLLIKLLTKVNSFKNVQAVGGFSIFNQLSKGIDNERGDYVRSFFHGTFKLSVVNRFLPIKAHTSFSRSIGIHLFFICVDNGQKNYHNKNGTRTNRSI